MAASPNKPTNPEALDHAVVARLKVEARQSGQDFFPQYVAYFAEDLEQAANDLQNTANERDASQLLYIAHRLRGAAGNFGAQALIELCVEVEKLAKDKRLQEARMFLPVLRAELRRVQEAVQVLRS